MTKILATQLCELIRCQTSEQSSYASPSDNVSNFRVTERSTDMKHMQKHCWAKYTKQSRSAQKTWCWSG
jgi:hypothetical protein